MCKISKETQKHAQTAARETRPMASSLIHQPDLYEQRDVMYAFWRQ